MYFEIEEFKKILKLDKRSYDRFANITVKVIRPSLLEINTKTDLNVEYELVMSGRKAVGLKFFIEQKTIKKYTVHKQDGKTNKNQLKFTDYEQRTYDYDELERKLLGWDKAE
jgi:plasmid replication initiation protein